MHTYRRNEFLADLGAMVVTGLAGNPLGILSKQTCMELYPVKGKCPLYDNMGEEVSGGP